MSTLKTDYLSPLDGSVTIKVKDIPQETSVALIDDGVTDNTALLQEALNSGSKVIHLGEGTFITGSVTIPAGVTLIGKGTGQTILVPVNNSQLNIVTLSGSRPQFIGVSLTGPGSGASGDERNGYLSVIEASDFVVEDVRIEGAPKMGAIFYNCTKGDKRSIVKNLLVKNAVVKGIVVYSPCLSIYFVNIEQYGAANHGFSFEPYDWAALEMRSVSDIHIDDLYAHDNPEGFGLFTFSLIASGTSFTDFAYSFTEQMLYKCSFSNLRLINNYTGLIGGGERCVYKGIEAHDNSGSAGVVYSGYNCVMSGVSSTGNKTYGVDMGGATNCSLTNFNLYGNNPDGDFCIALNVGGCVGCSITNGNITSNGGDNASCTSIVLSGVEGDGAYAYTQRGGFNRISNIYVQGTVNQYAIRTLRSDASSVIENITLSGSFNHLTCVQDKTMNTRVPTIIRNITIPDDDFSDGYVATAATQLIIPDHSEFVYVKGTTAITSILTKSQSLFSGVITDASVTSFGSGYAATDTVTVTGDGAGATAKLDIARGTGGAVVSLIITNGGSGYTTAAFSVTSAAGSGLVAVPLIGDINCQERVATFFFESALTIQVPGMNNSFSAIPGSTLTLKRTKNGSWAEISRAS